MKINSIMVHDVKAKKYFAFVKQFPGVCAQGNSKAETVKKINKNWFAFIKKMSEEKIEFEQASNY